MLIAIPASARAYAVLLEPMSVVAKGDPACLDDPAKARMASAASPGLGRRSDRPAGYFDFENARLGCRHRGQEGPWLAKGTDRRTVRRPVPQRRRHPYSGIGAQGHRFDLIFEATGSSEAAFNSIHALAANGVLCLTSVTGGSLAKPLPIDRINCDLVLGNKLVFGTVNAGRADFSEGLSFMKPVEKSYPGTLSLILTGRITFEHADRMFEIQKNGIKTVFEVFSAV